jgi:hypothetical protein
VKYYHHPSQSLPLANEKQSFLFAGPLRGQSIIRWHSLQAQNRVSSFNTDYLITKIHPKYGVQALSLLVNREIYFFLQVLLEGTIMAAFRGPNRVSKFEHYSFDF